jgi:hypothetical protein
MRTFKYKVGDSFGLDIEYQYVVSVTKEKLFTLALKIDYKGITSGEFRFVSYDLTKKEDLKILSEISNNFPETKFGQIGSKVVYDEDEFVLFGLKTVVFGTMTFIKPLLINTDKMMDLMEDVFIGADDITDLKTTFDLNYARFSKIPMESNKTLEVFEVAPPKFPVTTVQKIEVRQEDQKQQATSNLIPILKNTNIGSRGNYAYDVVTILQGLTLPYDQDDLYTNGLPYTIIGEGKYRTEQSTWNIFGGGISSGRGGSPTYILSEGEKLFPDWKLTTDSLYPIGTKLRSNKTGDYENSIIFKVIAIEFFDTMFGRFSARSNDKNDAYINHPETYLGGNKYFAISQTDLFLLLGKQPLKGTKKDGLDSVWYKPIGSTQFPLKTRKQLESGFTRYPYSSVLEGNLERYEISDISPSNYYPKSFKDIIEQKKPQLQLLAGENFYKNRYSINLSWEAFKLLSDIGSASNSTTEKNEIVEKLMEYFDYDNLNIIKNNNPKLYDKINDLMGKSIKLYIQNLPNKKITISQSNSVEYFLMYLGRLSIQFRNETNERKYYGLDIDIRQGGNSQMSLFKDTDDDELNIIFKNYIKLIDDFVANNNHLETYDFLIPLNRIIEIVQIYVIMCKFAMDKLVELDYINVNFEPNIYGSLYVSNFVAAYDYTDAFNKYGEPFFPTLNFGEGSYAWTGKSKYQYNFNLINLQIDVLSDDDTKENIKIYKTEIQKLHSLILDNFLLIKRFNQLGRFIKVFQYYDLASKKVDVNFEDITNDIRFKYYLRFANLIGHFKEVDFVNILKIFETIREVALSTAKFGKFITAGNSFDSTLGWKFEPTLLDFDATIFDYGNPRAIYKKLTDDGFNVDEYAQVATTMLDIILLEPKVIVQYFKKISDGMKQNTSFKLLLEGAQTPQEMWLRIFGGGDLTMSIADEEDVEIEGEPKITVEEVEDVNTDDIDWDEIDPDLDNLEIF